MCGPRLARPNNCASASLVLHTVQFGNRPSNDAIRSGTRYGIPGDFRSQTAACDLPNTDRVLCQPSEKTCRDVRTAVHPMRPRLAGIAATKPRPAIICPSRRGLRSYAAASPLSCCSVPLPPVYSSRCRLSSSPAVCPDRLVRVSAPARLRRCVHLIPKDLRQWNRHCCRRGSAADRRCGGPTGRKR
jgi:hypothetical protein